MSRYLLEPRLIPVPIIYILLDAIHFRLCPYLIFVAHIRFYDSAVVVEFFSSRTIML